MEYAIICRLEGMSRGRRISVAPNGDATFAPNRLAASLWPSREAAQEYAERAIVLREGTPSFRTVGNHAGLFWFSIYRFSVFNGAPPAVPA